MYNLISEYFRLHGIFSKDDFSLQPSWTWFSSPFRLVCVGCIILLVYFSSVLSLFCAMRMRKKTHQTTREPLLLSVLRYIFITHFFCERIKWPCRLPFVLIWFSLSLLLWPMPCSSAFNIERNIADMIHTHAHKPHTLTYTHKYKYVERT